MKLSQLHPNEGQIKGVPSNPRTITAEDFAYLLKSLRNFRKMLSLRPMVVDEDFNILGGNMRYQALCRLRDEKVKVGGFTFTDDIPDEWVKQDCTLTEKEKREFVIKDNQERGQNDWDKLANEWDAEELKEWDVKAAEWDDKKDGKGDGEEKQEKPKCLVITITLSPLVKDKWDDMKERISALCSEWENVVYEVKN